LALGGVAFDVPSDLLESDWWDALGPTVGRSLDFPYPVDDSKNVFGKPNGREGAARTIAGLLGTLPHCAERSFGCIEPLVEAIAVCCLDEVRAEHWFAERPSLSLSADGGLCEAMNRLGVTIATAAFDLLFPRRFNRLLREFDNKADVERSALEPLLKRLLSDPAAPEEIRIVVDRLGGRKFYRAIVETIAGDAFVLTSVETPALSRYVFELDGRRIEVSFAVAADGFSLPVAFASMVAKYLRECAMAGFNAYWVKRVPGLKPTAGYYADAYRFRRDVGKRLKEFGVTKAEFWRDR